MFKNDTCSGGEPLCVSCRHCSHFWISEGKTYSLCNRTGKAYVNVGVCKDYENSNK